MTDSESVLGKRWGDFLAALRSEKPTLSRYGEIRRDRQVLTEWWEGMDS